MLPGQHLSAPIVLIWDGLPAHKSAKMRALITARPWLRVYRLPSYAPELNPVENMWSSLKRSMVNLAPGRIDDLLRIDGAVDVRHIRAADEHVDRGAVAVADQVVLAAGLAAVDW
ncbi:transposase [Actinoplanes sp. NPDC020271]|uniref:transposase n=1 Tax=Actinoplanes sp. NPDC020271 TaxID=3363896 RepID=UPI0037A1BEFD